MTYPPCLLCGSEFLGNVGDICLDCEDKLSRVPSVIALREQVAALEIHNVELERLQKGNERLQEELEAMACQLGAQDAELTSLCARAEKAEEEVKRFKKALDWAYDTIDWDDTIILKEMTGYGELDEDEKAYLRRRAGKGEG